MYFLDDELYNFWQSSGQSIDREVFKTIVELLRVPVSPYELLRLLETIVVEQSSN